MTTKDTRFTKNTNSYLGFVIFETFVNFVVD